MPLESDVKVSKVNWVVPPSIYTQLNASKNRYHEGRGGGSVRRDTGIAGQIMDESIINNCLGFLKTFKSSDVWNTLQDYWKMYQKKQYNKGNDNQVDEVGGHDEEYNKSNK